MITGNGINTVTVNGKVKHITELDYITLCLEWTKLREWICPYISRHLLSLNPLQARCRRYSRGER